MNAITEVRSAKDLASLCFFEMAVVVHETRLRTVSPLMTVGAANVQIARLRRNFPAAVFTVRGEEVHPTTLDQFL